MTRHDRAAGEERACVRRRGAVRAARGALTVGALFGYSSVNSTESLKVPSSHAVSSGLLRVRVRVRVRVSVRVPSSRALSSGLCATAGQERVAKESRRVDEIA